MHFAHVAVLHCQIVMFCKTPPPPPHTHTHTQIQLYAGLYHGDEELCNTEGTRPVQAEVVGNEGTLVWNINEFIEFNIKVMDLPRGARLCLGIYALYGGKSKSKKKKQEVGPLSSLSG